MTALPELLRRNRAPQLLEAKPAVRKTRSTAVKKGWADEERQRRASWLIESNVGLGRPLQTGAEGGRAAGPGD